MRKSNSHSLFELAIKSISCVTFGFLRVRMARAERARKRKRSRVENELTCFCGFFVFRDTNVLSVTIKKVFLIDNVKGKPQILFVYYSK